MRKQAGTCEVEICYPKSWSMPVDPARYEGPERATVAWMDRNRLLESAEMRRGITKARSGRAAADSYPNAILPRLNTVAQLLGVWYVYDDRFDADPDWAVGLASPVGQALAGDLDEARSEDHPMHSWWDLGEEFKRTMSRDWRTRLGKHFEAWMFAANDEVALLARDGQAASTEEYIAVRSYTAGLDVWMDLIEYALARELPIESFADPWAREIRRVTRILALIDNDLLSVTKDSENGWLNIVFSVAAERGVSLPEGFFEAARLHDVFVRRFELIAARCIELSGSNLRWWIDAVRHALSGLLIWQMDAPRYSPLYTTADGTEVRVIFRFGDPSSEGVWLSSETALPGN